MKKHAIQNAVKKYLNDEIKDLNIDDFGYDLSEYGFSGKQYSDLSQEEKIICIHNIFISEYGYNLTRMSETKAFAEWLRGLPCLTVFFYNSDILNFARGIDVTFKNEHQEDFFIENWFNEVSIAFRSLHSKAIFNQSKNN